MCTILVLQLFCSVPNVMSAEACEKKCLNDFNVDCTKNIWINPKSLSYVYTYAAVSSIWASSVLIFILTFKFMKEKRAIFGSIWTIILGFSIGQIINPAVNYEKDLDKFCNNQN